MPAKPKLFLFDFDGTLADSFSAAIAAANRLAPIFEYAPISAVHALALKGRSSRELIRESGVPLRKLPAWIRQMKLEIQHEIPHMVPPPGLDAALSGLIQTGASLGIVTSNSRENVHLFLQAQSWEDCFQYMECGSNLFGKSRLIKRLLAQSGFAASDTFYVGDEERDIDAARRAGVSSIAVTWGFNTRDLLAKSRPDHLIDHPAELREIIREA